MRGFHLLQAKGKIKSMDPFRKDLLVDILYLTRPSGARCDLALYWQTLCFVVLTYFIK